MSSNRARRVAKEIADIHSDTISNISAEPTDGSDGLMHLKGSFKGPPGTPYEGGIYKIDIRIPGEYPFRPPIMKFDTKVWHPNVSSQTVCITCQGLHVLAGPLTVSIGRYLPRYPIVCLVSSPHHKVRASFSPIPSQYSRAKGSARR